MNMHVASDSIAAEAPLVTARLPDEPDLEETDGIEAPEPKASDAPPPPRKARRGRRTVLLGSVAAVAIVASAGFLLSPYNHIVPLPARMRAAESRAGNGQPVLAPSAELAQVNVPPPADPAVRTPYVGQPQGQEVSEVVALRTGAASATPPPGVPAAGGDGPPPGFVPHEPGAGSAEHGTPPAAPAASVGLAGQGAAPTPPSPTVSSVTDPETQTAASALAEPSPTAPAPISTPDPPAVSTGDITQQVMTRVTASLDLKPLTPPAAPALPEPSPAADQTGAPAQPAPGSGQRVAFPATAHSGAAASATRPTIPPATAAAADPPAPPPESDAAQTTAALQPSPMTPHDQVQVLDLVTQMATMVRDLKKENAQMRADFAKSQAEETARIADWERRLALAEARSAVTAADAAGSTPFVVTANGAAGKPDATPPDAARAAASLVPLSTTASTTAVVPAEGDTGKKYRLQAASPGLAMLAEIDRGGGEGAQIQVAVGDTVPGYGRVKAVTQRGTTWVVETEHGQIE